MEVLRRAGVPRGVVNLVTPVPTGPLVKRMIDRPEVRKLSFTGSTEVGRELLHACADSVVSTSMELGGNAPLVVLPGADLDTAVEGALLAKMRNGGSACTAANRFYVHSSVHDEFVARMDAALAAVSVGPGLDRANDLGALVSVAERDKVADLVRTAVAEGATVVRGGRSAAHGAFYDATLLTGVAHGSTITTTEIFGPVTAVVRFDHVDDAVRMANDTVLRPDGVRLRRGTGGDGRSPASGSRDGRRQPGRRQRPGRSVRRGQAERPRPGGRLRGHPGVPGGEVHRAHRVTGRTLDEAPGSGRALLVSGDPRGSAVRRPARVPVAGVPYLSSIRLFWRYGGFAPDRAPSIGLLEL